MCVHSSCAVALHWLGGVLCQGQVAECGRGRRVGRDDVAALKHRVDTEDSDVEDIGRRSPDLLQGARRADPDGDGDVEDDVVRIGVPPAPCETKPPTMRTDNQRGRAGGGERTKGDGCWFILQVIMYSSASCRRNRYGSKSGVPSARRRTDAVMVVRMMGMMVLPGARGGLLGGGGKGGGNGGGDGGDLGGGEGGGDN